MGYLECRRFDNGIGMDELEESEMRERLEQQRVEHRRLDEAIDQMTSGLLPDQFLLQRMKKRKLQLKDSIERLKSKLIPDLEA